jgi:hypothetical protein
VHAPVTEWLSGVVSDSYQFVLRGAERRNARIERVV